jgi:carboxymethylenebutenolidase
MCHDHCPRPVSGGDAIDEQEVAIPLMPGSLPAFLAVPDQRPAPAVLVIHDIHGPNDFYHDLARRLALAGYVALLPDFFHRLPPAADDTPDARRARGRAMPQASALTDIESALIWLRNLEAGTGRTGTIGFCMGGTLVYLAAAREPVPDASVAFYGFPFRERTPLAPILPGDEGEVATIQSPLLAFWGTEDAGVGMDNVDRYEGLLKHYRKEHEIVRYEGVGHGFLTFEENTPASAASRDAWDRTLAFLGKRLRPGTA